MIITSRISTHAPRAGSDYVFAVFFYAVYISTHAPRAGSDIERREAVGILYELFAWGLFAAEKDGLLEGLSADDIGKALDFPTPKKRRMVVDALVSAGYLDYEDGSYYIHNWYEYAGKWNESREKNRESVRKHRQRKKEDQNADD